MTKEKPAAQLIYLKISDVMNDINAIGKDNKNVQQNYKFRGIDDVYNELHSILAKHKVFTVPEIIDERTEIKTTKSGTELLYRIIKMKYHFYAEDGSFVTASVIGEGMDSGDKASNKAMAVAHKYALTQVFCIPTEDKKDPEHESHDLAANELGVEEKYLEDIYSGRADHKRFLASLFTKMNVIDVVSQKKVHEELMREKSKLKDLKKNIEYLKEVNFI